MECAIRHNQGIPSRLIYSVKEDPPLYRRRLTLELSMYFVLIAISYRANKWYKINYKVRIALFARLPRYGFCSYQAGIRVHSRKDIARAPDCRRIHYADSKRASITRRCKWRCGELTHMVKERCVSTRRTN